MTDKELVEFTAEELKALCAKKIHETYPEIFNTLERAEQHLWYLQYDINDYFVTKPLGKGTRGILGVTAEGKLFVNEDEGCWTEYCNTDNWENENKVDVINKLYDSINEYGFTTSKDSCEQLVNWIFEAKAKNVVNTNKLHGGFSMDFEPDPVQPMTLFDK